MDTASIHSPGNDEILIVDDAVDSLRLLADLLTGSGYHVRPASDGVLALRSAQAKLPALILLDIRMPGIDGYQVCRQLKADERTRSIPVIFISASESEADKVKGFQVGAVDYINKPFRASEVLARVHTHLTLHHTQVELERANAELAAARDGLEVQVRARTAELEQTNQNLERQIAENQRTLHALAASQARYHLLFENSPVSLWEEDFSGVKALFDELKKAGVTNIELHLAQHPETVQGCAEAARIVDVNQAALTLHAAANKADLLAGLVNTFTPESFDTFRQELVCLWNGGTEMTRDAVIKTLAGERRNVTVSLSVCPGYEGTLSKVLVSLTDITERKRAEEALKKQYSTLRGIIDSANALIFSVDRRYRYTSFNQGHAAVMQAIYGAKIEIGRSLLEYMTVTEDRETARRNLDRALAGEQLVEEAYSGEEPLSRQYFRVSHSPIKTDTGEVIGVAVLSQDITERQRVEEALRKRNEELERFERAVIGRELKMIELKKRIAELEEKSRHQKGDRHES